MTYELPSPLQKTWEMTLDAAERGDLKSAAKGCNAILQQQPDFQPAQDMLVSIAAQRQESGNPSKRQKLDGVWGDIQGMFEKLFMMNRPEHDLESKQAHPVTSDEKMFAALGYFPLLQVLSLVFKRQSSFVAVHALSGIVISLGLFVTSTVVNALKVFGGFFTFLGLLLVIIAFVVLGLGVYQALTGQMSNIPVISDLARKLYHKYMLPNA